MRARHVLGDHAPDAANRLAAALRLGGRRAVRRCSDVPLGDPAARTAARERGEVDPELVRDPAYERRGGHACG
jgi:hypothetical protein